jgi:hypothetical protein
VTLVRIRVAPSCLLRLQKRWGPSSEAKNKKAAALAPRTTRVSWGYGTSLPPSPPEREREREREGQRARKRERGRLRERARARARERGIVLGSTSWTWGPVHRQQAQTLAKETYKHWQKRPTDTGKRDLPAASSGSSLQYTEITIQIVSAVYACMYVCVRTHTHTHTHTPHTHTHTHTQMFMDEIVTDFDAESRATSRAQSRNQKTRF